MGLRLLYLPVRAFWFDEAFTYEIAKLPFVQIWPAVLTDSNPPLYYLLIHFLLFLSKNPLVLRLPSLVFNLATIWLTFLIGKKLFPNRVAVVTTILLAISPLQIYLATEARLHALAGLFLVGIIHSFFDLTTTVNRKNLVFFVLWSILGLYTQYYILLVFLPLTILVFTEPKKLTPIKWTQLLSLIFLIWSPWLAAALITPHSPCACPPTWLSLPASLVSPILGGIGEVTLRAFPNLPTSIQLIFVAAVFFAGVFFVKGFFYSHKPMLILVFPLFLLTAGSLFVPAFSPKAFAIFSPLYFLIIARGLDLANPFYTKVFLLLLIVVTLIQIFDPFFAGEKLQLVKSLIDKQPAVVVHTSVSTYYSFDFYTQNRLANYLITPNPLSFATRKFIGGQYLFPPREKSLWLVDTEKWTIASQKELALTKIFADYKTSQSWHIGNLKILYLIQK